MGVDQKWRSDPYCGCIVVACVAETSTGHDKERRAYPGLNCCVRVVFSTISLCKDTNKCCESLNSPSLFLSRCSMLLFTATACFSTCGFPVCLNQPCSIPLVFVLVWSDLTFKGAYTQSYCGLFSAISDVCLNL